MNGEMRNKLTAERAREMFDYDAETGKLFWRVRAASHVRVGDEAGSTVVRNGTQYRRTKAGGYLHYNHRLIWLIVTGQWPTGQIDHEDGDGLNNRWHNLRDANNQQNSKNSKMYSTNTSGVTGVYWNKACGKWQVNICVDGKPKYLGLFKDLEDAASTRKSAEIKYGYHENHGRKAA